jgi:hypothetical protein
LISDVAFADLNLHFTERARRQAVVKIKQTRAREEVHSKRQEVYSVHFRVAVAAEAVSAGDVGVRAELANAYVS